MSNNENKHISNNTNTHTHKMALLHEIARLLMMMAHNTSFLKQGALNGKTHDKSASLFKYGI
jgi:hypothetical protein